MFLPYPPLQSEIDFFTGTLNSLLVSVGLPSGTGSVLVRLLPLGNILIMVFMVMLVIRQTARASSEGACLGQILPPVMNPITVILVFLIATPLPFASGLSMLQLVVVFVFRVIFWIAGS